jgi:Uma2 family endonuclease
LYWCFIRLVARFCLSCGFCGLANRDSKPPHVYLYADVSVACGQRRFDDQMPNSLLNPVVLIEVLPSSTEDYDRTTKFEMYQTIPSLRDYLLVSQERVEMLHYSRVGDGWRSHLYTRLDEMIDLDSIGCQLPVSEVYLGVEWASH